MDTFYRLSKHDALNIRFSNQAIHVTSLSEQQRNRYARNDNRHSLALWFCTMKTPKVRTVNLSWDMVCSLT